jgi:dolichyl-diphosphooligosaccharide--protein glycosyltransferase
VRLMLTLTPIVCVAAAIAISNILETYLVENDEELEDDEEEFKVTGKKGDKSITFDTLDAGIKSPGLKFTIVGGVSLLLCLFAFHCTYVTSTAYSSPSVVLASQNRDGSQHIIDDFREAYYWLRQNVFPQA